MILTRKKGKVVYGSSGEIDATTVCNWVIDGDTFDTTTQGRIRMADVDSPESGQTGYYDAKNYLISLIYGKTVYLDIDDIYQTDPYDRLVCVVYIRWNSTLYLNANKAMLVTGHAIISNYYNEFNPYSWGLYVHETEIPEFSSLIVLPFFTLITLAMILVYRRFFQKQ